MHPEKERTRYKKTEQMKIIIYAAVSFALYKLFSNSKKHGPRGRMKVFHRDTAGNAVANGPTDKV